MMKQNGKFFFMEMIPSFSLHCPIRMLILYFSVFISYPHLGVLFFGGTQSSQVAVEC